MTAGAGVFLHRTQLIAHTVDQLTRKGTAARASSRARGRSEGQHAKLYCQFRPLGTPFIDNERIAEMHAAEMQREVVKRSRPSRTDGAGGAAGRDSKVLRNERHRGISTVDPLDPLCDEADDGAEGEDACKDPDLGQALPRRRRQQEGDGFQVLCAAIRESGKHVQHVRYRALPEGAMRCVYPALPQDLLEEECAEEADEPVQERCHSARESQHRGGPGADGGDIGGSGPPHDAPAPPSSARGQPRFCRQLPTLGAKLGHRASPVPSLPATARKFEGVHVAALGSSARPVVGLRRDATSPGRRRFCSKEPFVPEVFKAAIAASRGLDNSATDAAAPTSLHRGAAVGVAKGVFGGAAGNTVGGAVGSRAAASAAPLTASPAPFSDLSRQHTPWLGSSTGQKTPREQAQARRKYDRTPLAAEAAGGGPSRTLDEISAEGAQLVKDLRAQCRKDEAELKEATVDYERVYGGKQDLHELINSMNEPDNGFTLKPEEEAYLVKHLQTSMTDDDYIGIVAEHGLGATGGTLREGAVGGGARGEGVDRDRDREGAQLGAQDDTEEGKCCSRCDKFRFKPRSDFSVREWVLSDDVRRCRECVWEGKIAQKYEAKATESKREVAQLHADLQGYQESRDKHSLQAKEACDMVEAAPPHFWTRLAQMTLADSVTPATYHSRKSKVAMLLGSGQRRKDIFFAMLEQFKDTEFTRELARFVVGLASGAESVRVGVRIKNLTEWFKTHHKDGKVPASVSQLLAQRCTYFWKLMVAQMFEREASLRARAKRADAVDAHNAVAPASADGWGRVSMTDVLSLEARTAERIARRATRKVVAARAAFARSACTGCSNIRKLLVHDDGSHDVDHSVKALASPVPSVPTTPLSISPTAVLRSAASGGQNSSFNASTPTHPKEGKEGRRRTITFVTEDT